MRLAHHMMTWRGWARKHEQDLDIDQMLDEIKDAGYTGVELGGDAESLGPASALAEKLAARDLAIAAWATAVTANPWPPNTEQYRRAMDYAAELDVKTLMVCGGFLGEKRRTTFESDYELFGENMANAMDYARQNGQTIAYHPHVGCIVETLAEMQRLWRYVPNLDICIDTGHLIAVREDPNEFLLHAPEKVIHVHLKDWDTEKTAFAELGEGNAGIDFARFFALLREHNYQGWLCVERDSTPIPPVESARISRAFLRQFEDDIAALTASEG